MLSNLFKTSIILCISLTLFCSVKVFGAGAYSPNETSNQNLNATHKINFKDADRRIKEAYDKAQSNFWVQSQGEVVKVLKDDTDGDRHQRFLLRLSNGHTILIVHNIDIAPKIEGLKPGDTVAFYGEYAWNNKGGVVHWTHHDPSRRRIGGWLMHQGKRYE
jgi:molybdopterin converting factor small subunit